MDGRRRVPERNRPRPEAADMLLSNRIQTDYLFTMKHMPAGGLNSSVPSIPTVIYDQAHAIYDQPHGLPA